MKTRAMRWAGVVVAVAVAGTAAMTWGQDLGKAKPARKAPAQTAPAQAGPPEGMQNFPPLVDGLKNSPGCLGVETAQTGSGKQVIFAWFEDKNAVTAWYNSDMHVGAMQAFFGRGPSKDPMKGVPDDAGPLMVIASITMDQKAHFDETNLPISQIAIEIYEPVTGGLFLGSRFAPEGVKVKNLKDYTPRR